jgi:hypothetical protein
MALAGLKGIDLGTGGIAVKAAGLVAATAQTTAVFAGRGLILFKLTTTECEIASNTENYTVVVQANSVGAPSTWVDLGCVAVYGATEITGQADSADAEDKIAAVFNPYDHQIRLNIGVDGDVATGINFTCDAFPVPNTVAY